MWEFYGLNLIQANQTYAITPDRVEKGQVIQRPLLNWITDNRIATYCYQMSLDS